MTLAIAVLAMALFGQSGQSDQPLQGHDLVVPRNLEGRPPASDASTLQPRIDQAAAGATIEIDGGAYIGDLVIDKPLTLIGRRGATLIGSGHGTVVRVRADDVTIEGFAIDGRGGGDLGRDSSGIHVSGRRATIRSCTIVNALFGIYLREADAVTVDRNTVRGIPGKEPGEKGSGIHVWNTDGFVLTGNEIAGVRDGFYIQSSSHGRIAGNTARDLRYGLHYMFSDDNVFEDNTFANGAAGTALMYSKRVTFRRNRFVHNRGFASVGLLLKACDDVVAEDNLLADNARGVFLEGSVNSVFRRNLIAESDVAVVLYDSCSRTVFEGNSFVANLTPLSLVGRRTDTRFAGNYFSDNDEPDLDGDGRSDRPYRLSSVFDHLRGNILAADLLAQSPAASALAAAERAFPVLEPIRVVDDTPLAHAPLLAVPTVERSESRSAGAIAASAGVGVLGLAVLIGARRTRRGRP